MFTISISSDDSLSLTHVLTLADVALNSGGGETNHNELGTTIELITPATRWYLGQLTTVIPDIIEDGQELQPLIALLERAAEDIKKMAAAISRK